MKIHIKDRELWMFADMIKFFPREMCKFPGNIDVGNSQVDALQDFL